MIYGHESDDVGNFLVLSLSFPISLRIMLLVPTLFQKLGITEKLNKRIDPW
jgi:hypothetical protein